MNNGGKMNGLAKKPEAILAIISLACFAFNFIYSLRGVAFGSQYYIFSAIGIAARALLVLYTLSLFEKDKAKMLLPVLFGLVAVGPLYNLISGFARLGFASEQTKFLLHTLPVAVAVVLAMICAIRGFSEKVLLKVAVAILIIAEVIGNPWLPYLVGAFRTLFSGYVISSLYDICSFVTIITLYVALLLVGLKSDKYMAQAVPREKLMKMHPGKALRLLQNERELGVITEEEYTALRDEILSKL